jgi:hypothetical protein
MKSFIYEHTHPCRWVKIILNFKFQTQSSKFRFHAHAQTIFFSRVVFISVITGGYLMGIHRVSWEVFIYIIAHDVFVV